MKSFGSFLSIILVGALIAFLPADGLASTYGKVTGTVQDENGNPLPGANVVVEGTQRGATSDADGSFLIIGVPPGEHEVTASMVGYATSSLRKVLVQSDFTTTVRFSLTEAALEAAEMVVTAQRPPVELDRTSSRYVIDIFEIQNVPLARTSEDLIELEPGVSMDGSLRIRGGGNEDQISEVDGVRIIRSDGETSMGGDGNVMFLGVNKSALQEVSILTGGMDAEYGHATARVSLITQEAASAFSGLGEYRFTPPMKKHWGRNVYKSGIMQKHIFDQTGSTTLPSALAGKVPDYTDEMGHYMEGSIGGPLSDQAGIFATVSHSREAGAFPEAELVEPMNYKLSGNVTFRPTGDLKLKVGGLYSYYKIWRGERRAMTSGGGLWGVDTPTNVLNLFLPGDYSAYGPQDNKEALYYAVATHSLNPKTFWEFRAAYGTRLIENQEYKTNSAARLTDDLNFTLPYDQLNFDDTDRKRWIFKGDITSQMHKNHLVKAGFEHVRYSFTQHEQNWQVRTPSVAFRYTGYGDPVIGIEPAKPTQYAAYIQDKMEFEGLIINAGIRADFFRPGEVSEPGFGNWDFWGSLTKSRARRYVDHPLTWSVSPRIGISHPISERAMVRFYTGVFRMLGTMHGYYIQSWDGNQPISADVNGNGVIDEQTELYNRLNTPHNQHGPSVASREGRESMMEVGMDWNFAGDYVGSLTMFYADKNGPGGTYYSAARHLWPAGFNGREMKAQSNATGYSARRGFELSFKKMFSQMTSFSVAWNVQWVGGHYSGQGGFMVPSAAFVNSDRFFLGTEPQPDGSETPRVPTAAERAEYVIKAQTALDTALDKVGQDGGEGAFFMPVVENGGDGLYFAPQHSIRSGSLEQGIDRRNYGSAQFLFSAPTDYHITALQGFRATMLWRIQQGLTFFYTAPGNPSRQVTGPLSTVTDLNLERDFQVGETGTVTAFVEVRNAFNQMDVGIFDGQGFEQSYMQYGLTERPPDDAEYLKYGNIEEYTVHYGAASVNRVHNTYGYFDLVDKPVTLTQPRVFTLGARLRF